MKVFFGIVLMVILAGCIAKPGALKVSGGYTVKACYGESK